MAWCEFDAQGKVIGSLGEAGAPPSNYAVTGIYFYDDRASAFAKALEPVRRAANSRSPI